MNFITSSPQKPDASPHWGKAIFQTRICKSCEKMFMSRGVLKNHKLGHTGEKPIFGF